MLSSTLSSIIIEGNVIDQGFSTTDGITPTNYTYATDLFTMADCDVSDNVFGGIAASGIMVDILSCSCTITNNKFVRGTTTITAYIRNTGTPDSSITNNLFDQITIDGTNLALTSGVNPTSVYYGNVNQTVFITVSLTDYMHYIVSTGGNVNIPGAGTAYAAAPTFTDATNGFSVTRFRPSINTIVTNATPDAEYLVVSDFDTSTPNGTRNFGLSVPLDYVLPPGVKIIQATIGIWLQESGAGALNTSSDSGNRLTLSLLTFLNTNTNANSANGVADVKNSIITGSTTSDLSLNSGQVLSSTLIVGSTGAANVTEAAMKAATNYCQITSTTLAAHQGFFTTGNGFRIAASFDMNYARTNPMASGNVNWYISPIVIAYRW